MNGPIRVLIADDHPVVRRGLAVFLQTFDDLALVGEASDGAEALRLSESIRPDVALVDLVMPTMDGIAAIAAIREASPSTRLVGITSQPSEVQMQEALRAGATSLILKDVSPQELARAIRDTHHGHQVLAPAAAEALERLRQGEEPQVYGLTSRELEVLRQLTEGLTNAEIAERLTVSRATVNFHVGNILGKLGAATRTEAVATALRERLLPG